MKKNRKYMYIMLMFIIILIIIIIIKKLNFKRDNNSNGSTNENIASIGGGSGIPYAQQRDLNNPGFIIRSSIMWDGEINPNDNKFEKFVTMEHGIRAAKKNLIAYNKKYGLENISEIIQRWSGGKNENYINYVKNKVGKDYINFADDDEINKAIMAIFDFEGYCKWKELNPQKRIELFNKAMEGM